MRQKFLLISVLFAFLSQAQTAKDFFNRASKKYQDQEYAAAAVEYTRALELAPESAVLFNNRGLCYYKLEQWDKAADDYDRALTLDPAYKQAFLNLGNVSLDKGDYEAALLSFDKALSLDSFYTPVYAKRAYTLYQLEDYKGSLEYYDKAIEYAPVERATLFNARGATYAKLGKTEMAIADYDKTLDLTPDAYETFINRGILKAKMQKYEAAIQDFTVAQSFAGMSGEGYYYRGLCRVGQLDAIRGTKEKHYVMDIKANNKLLELACSDFDKAKQFSYGRAFEAYQEYCVEKKGEDPVVTEMDDTTDLMSLNTLVAELPITGTIQVASIPKVKDLQTISVALSMDERTKLKQKIKAEILAEYELVPREKLVKTDTGLPLVLDLSSIVADSAITVDSNVSKSLEIDSSYSHHIAFDAYRDSIIMLFYANSNSSVTSNGFHQADSFSEISNFSYQFTTLDSNERITILDMDSFITDYIYLKGNNVLMHISQYLDSDEEVPEVFQELSVFENNEIIYQRSADCGAPNSRSYVKDVEQYVLEIVELTKPK